MTFRPAPGSLIGHYEVITELARGGMAQVLLARDPQMGRDVAVKLLAPEFSDDETFRTRFLREARITANLEHPHVVPVYDAGEFEGLLYIVMRYVPGPDLREVLSHGPLDAQRAVNLLSQIASALDAAHQAGLVHRDVKPGNILLVEPATPADTEHAYLTDFGLVWRPVTSEDRTQPGALLGTPSYAAPEQLQGLPLDGRADVYALAAVLYACLTGEPPFPRESTVAAITAHLHEPPPHVTDLRPDLPRGLNGVLVSGLAKAREDRPRSCLELMVAAAAALGAASAAGDEPTLPPGLPRRSVKVPSVGTPLVGRTKELATITELVSSHERRLVTLLGAGGTGKTRLAIEAAASLVSQFPGGVYFVSLADATTAESILSAIAAVVEIQESVGEPLTATIARSMVSQPTLLVLDNLEQAIDAAAETAAELLRQAQTLTILATSRIPCRLSSEQRFNVLPLEPVDAVALFLQRAQAIDPAFTADAETEEDVKRICQRVEGVPLAIELAAARVAVMTPGELAVQLADQLTMLESSLTDLPERHRTLRATITWSYDLLDESDRHTLEALGVFGGAFRIDDLAPVAGLDPGAARDAISRLVECSLARRSAVAGTSEFRLLHSVREFAWERAVARGTADAVRQRLSRHLRDIVTRRTPQLYGADAKTSLRELRRVYPELRTLIPWMLHEQEPDASEELLVALSRYWRSDGQLTEARSWVAEAMTRRDNSGRDLSPELTLTAGVLAYLQDDRAQARAHLESVQACIDPDTHPGLHALATGYLGAISLGDADTETAQRCSGAAITFAERSGEYEPRILALSVKAVVAAVSGDLDLEQQTYHERLALCRSHGDARSAAETLSNLAEISLVAGDTQGGRGFAEEALALATPLSRMATRDVLYVLGRLDLVDGNVARALNHAREALTLSLDLGQIFETSQCITLVGAIAAASDDHRTSALLMGAGSRLRHERAPLDVDLFDLDLEPDLDLQYAHARQALGEPHFQRAFDDGTQMSLEGAVTEALAYEVAPGPAT